jgi:hypothetical protein
MTSEHRAVIDRIQTSAAAVRRAMAGVSPDRVARAPREGEWSVLETLTHLRDVVVHVQGLRIRRLLYERAPLFADFDEESYRRASLARGEAAADVLETIVAELEQVARLLRSLDDADWSREGHHPTLGAMSIERLARQLGEHTEEHAAQIASAARAG